MRAFCFARTALGGSAICALLVACGGGNPSASGALPAGYIGTKQSLKLRTHLKHFGFIGAAQTFTVPRGVTSIAVIAVGAATGVDDCSGVPAGDGGRVDAVIPVTQGERLMVYVGGKGGSAPSGTAGGFNGGGQGGSLGFRGTGGGGASDVRTSSGRLKDRIVVAGGGGGQGGGGFVSLYSGCGGGGGLDGQNGQSGGVGYCSGFAGDGGDGGNQTAGGAGGAGGEGSSKCPVSCSEFGQRGDDGARGSGGNGGAIDHAGGGGGGGGGYFGGGGGGSTCAGPSISYDLQGGGGGGGSSYAEPSATNVRYVQDWQRADRNGWVTFRW